MINQILNIKAKWYGEKMGMVGIDDAGPGEARGDKKI